MHRAYGTNRLHRGVVTGCIIHTNICCGTTANNRNRQAREFMIDTGLILLVNISSTVMPGAAIENPGVMHLPEQPAGINLFHTGWLMRRLKLINVK